MNIRVVADVAIEFFLLVAGYSQIAKGTAYGLTEKKYTKESVRKFSKPMGLITWLFALALGLIFVGQANVFNQQVSTIMGYAGNASVVLTIVVYYIASRKILEKKHAPMGYTYKKNNRKM
jgi:hypothetical protein